MFLKYLLVSAILLCATCCPEDDCAAVLCEGPPTLGFEVLKNNENVFLNGTYTLDNVTIEGEMNEEIVLNLANSEVPNSILTIYNANWMPDTYEYILNFSTDSDVAIIIDIVNSPPGGCCGDIPRLAQLTINGEVQENRYGFQILLD